MNNPYYSFSRGPRVDRGNNFGFYGGANNFNRGFGGLALMGLLFPLVRGIGNLISRNKSKRQAKQNSGDDFSSRADSRRERRLARKAARGLNHSCNCGLGAGVNNSLQVNYAD